MKYVRSAVSLLAFALTVAAQTNAADQVLPANVRACALEKDDVRRLACYDGEIASTTETAAMSETRTETATEPEPAPEVKFGYRGSIARQELDQEAAKTDQLDRLEATIKELSSRPRGELVFTLDNGQVWAQKAADAKIRVKVGDRVAIKKASFGSFLLVTPFNRTTRVTRER